MADESWDQEDVPAASGQPEPDWELIGDRLFAEMWNGYVHPELQGRRKDGRWREAEPLYRWQVLLHDASTEVRLNREVRGLLAVKLTAGTTWQAGGDVMLDQLDGVSDYTPSSNDADVPHVTAFLHARGWAVAFEFHRPHPSRHEHLRVALEFLHAARQAFEAGHLHAFVDNAFSTVELLAKTELLSCAPTVDIALNARRHGSVGGPYNVWAHLANTEARFARLLNRLQGLRDPARYLVGDLSLDTDGARELLDELDAMREHVARAVAGDDHQRGYNVIATRDVRAGTLVKKSDYTLWPQQRRESTTEPDSGEEPAS